MPLVDDQHLIQTLVPHRSDPPFRERVRPRRPHRCPELSYPQSTHAPIKRFAVPAVPVTDEIPWRVSIPAAGFHDLLGRPVGGGVSGHPNLQDLPGLVVHDEEDVQRPEEHRPHPEEVARPDVLGMALSRTSARWARGRRHRACACTWRRSVPTPGIPTGRAPPGRAVVPKGDSRRPSAESRPVSHPAGEADRPSFVAGIATANRPSIPVDASGARCPAERRAGTLAIEEPIDRRESRTGGRCRATSGAASGAPAQATAGAGRDSPRSRPLGV